VEERERACDEAVLSLGSEPHDYAEGILSVYKTYLESPLLCVSGVSGSNLKKRLQAILAGHVPNCLNLPKKVALTAAGFITLSAPIVVGLMSAPAIHAQSPTGGAPKFEEASIRLCADGEDPRKSDGDSPENFHVACQSVTNLIQEAYVFFANGQVNIGSSASITGGPSWTNADRYEIEAKAERPQNLPTKNGPMLQALLEDRFKLKIHRDTRDVPVFALIVAEGEPKLQPFQERSCIPPDFNHPPSPERPFPLVCGMTRVADTGFDAPGVTMARFCGLLTTSVPLGRNVIDKTGIAGTFNIHLDLSAADLGYKVPGAQTDPALILAGLNHALDSLGLKLEATNGPNEFIVIDSVERPSDQ
jgi:uncharacterized protein (TIGR03435 family)